MPGRPRTAAEVEVLVVGMAEENRNWGYRRIQGALANLGYLLAHNTIASILKQHGIDPAPQRSRKTTWRELLGRHWEQVVASDFFNRGDLDKEGIAAVCRAFLHGAIDTTSGDRRNREHGQWIMDGSDCAQPQR